MKKSKSFADCSVSTLFITVGIVTVVLFLVALDIFADIVLQNVYSRA